MRDSLSDPPCRQMSSRPAPGDTLCHGHARRHFPIRLTSKGFRGADSGTRRTSADRGTTADGGRSHARSYLGNGARSWRRNCERKISVAP